jgi:hypothetical protein
MATTVRTPHAGDAGSDTCLPWSIAAPIMIVLSLLGWESLIALTGLLQRAFTSFAP